MVMYIYIYIYIYIYDQQKVSVRTIRMLGTLVIIIMVVGSYTTYGISTKIS